MKLIFHLTSNPYNLRNKNPFLSTFPSVYNGTEIISYEGSKIWALVPEGIKQSKSIIEFKQRIRRWKPVGCTCRICKSDINDLDFI